MLYHSWITFNTIQLCTRMCVERNALTPYIDDGLKEMVDLHRVF